MGVEGVRLQQQGWEVQSARVSCRVDEWGGRVAPGNSEPCYCIGDHHQSSATDSAYCTTAYHWLRAPSHRWWLGWEARIGYVLVTMGRGASIKNDRIV